MMKFNTNQPALASVPVAQPQRKPIVVFCLPGYSFTPGFFDAWTRLLLMSKDLPFEIIVSRHYSPVIFHCRANLLGADNRAGKHQLPFQGRIPSTTSDTFDPSDTSDTFDRVRRVKESKTATSE